MMWIFDDISCLTEAALPVDPYDDEEVNAQGTEQYSLLSAASFILVPSSELLNQYATSQYVLHRTAAEVR